MNEIMEIAEISISYKPKVSYNPIIKTSEDAYKLLKSFFDDGVISMQERFVVMYVNNANKVIGVYIHSIGGITGTIADIRLILGTALKAVACSIILGHNHPSGNLKPSNADIVITKKIKEAAALMDIKLLDHLIISPENTYYSFADDGII